MMSLLLAMAVASSPPRISGADLVCTADGATLTAWVGSDSSPARTLSASARDNAVFRVDVASWSISVAPADKSGPRAFGVEVIDAAGGSRQVSKSTVRCDRPAGATLRLRHSPKHDGLDVVPGH